MERLSKEFHSGKAAQDFAGRVNGRLVAKSVSGSKKKFIVTYVKVPKNLYEDDIKVLTPKEKVFTRNKLRIAHEVSKEFGFIPDEKELINVKKHMEGFCNKTYNSQDLWNVLREFALKIDDDITEIIVETYLNNN